MRTKFKKIFATTVSVGTLQNSSILNRKLENDIALLSKPDKMGREWSKENYKGGYTSYGSLSDLQHRSPIFMELSEKLQPHANAFAKALGWEMRGFKLEMTACWMNVMGLGTYHTLHHHPQSVLSGVYYIKTPTKSAPLKLEDPRMSFYMHTPLKRIKANQENSHYFQVPAKAGQFVLFESWLRHEVPPNQSSSPRLCISFNFDLQPID